MHLHRSIPCALRRPLVALALALVAAVGGSGCATDPELEPLPLSQAAAELAPDDRAALEQALARLFGPPDLPRYAVLEGWAAAGFDPNAPVPAGASETLVGAIATDNARGWYDALLRHERGEDPSSPKLPTSLQRALDGSPDPAATIRAWQPDLVESARLFARECATCHGVAGGGDGRSAAQLDPVPRDFRSGEFVHRAVSPAPRPTQDDLVRVLKRGVAGTGMPLFTRLGPARQSGLADYVRFLSLRGEVERAWLELRAAEGSPPSAARMDEVYVEAWSRWAILPAPPAGTEAPMSPDGPNTGAAPSTDAPSPANSQTDEPR
ncbi:hypothetical protein Pla163_26730 [Planctomycetes bacterium Pla163]|uniref:Cytochrome c domain-containing protein n=1 Tax=Rohdeia mirabilis TaxID=2528008 RepID=A0A518D236_9BACT|nr:hypothetical protein Pla163_26730 [Planctomycetes bacterium Pla163]